MPDNARTQARRSTLARRLIVGALALAAALQIFSSQMSTVALLAQKPQYAAGLPFAQARPVGMRAWQLAEAGAPRDRVILLANLANHGSALNEPAFAAGARALGPDGAGSEWLDHAWHLSRRDPWLLQATFARARTHGDIDGEVTALAALLQLQLDPGPMRETFLADLARPSAFSRAVTVLREKPRWRHRYFDGLHIDPAQLTTASALIAALRDGGAPLSADDMSVLLEPLVYGKASNPAVADAVWRAWLGKADPWSWPTAGGNSVHLPFDWSLGDHARSEDAKLVFTGKDSTTEPVATKQLYLPAGQYRFVARPGPGLKPEAISAELVCNAQHFALENGAVWRTNSTCPNAELRLLVNGAEGSIASAGLF